MTLSAAKSFSDAPWITGARALRGARLFALVFFCAVAAASFLIWLQWRGHPEGKPIALDFDAFWAAARLAVGGHAASAYDNVAIEAMERSATDMPPGYLAFYYPPSFLLLCLPLGLLGYVPALLVFLAAEMAILLACLRRLLPQGWAWLPLLSYPGFFMNALSGQNAPLTAACFGGAALFLQTRPLLAGMCLGGLVCKPQLAVCVPVALLAARRFRALIACAATAFGLCVLSWIVLGTSVWHGFVQNAPNARADIETIAIKWPKLQSAFGTIRLAGGGNGTAYAVQAVVSFLVLAVLVRAVWRRPGGGVEASLMATASLLFTPFLYDYDLAILSVPMTWLMARGLASGWWPWEKYLLLALFLLPFFARASGMGLGVIIGPPFVAALMGVLALRALQSPPAQAA
jgi:hypothetical protein